MQTTNTNVTPGGGGNRFFRCHKSIHDILRSILAYFDLYGNDRFSGEPNLYAFLFNIVLFHKRLFFLPRKNVTPQDYIKKILKRVKVLLIPTAIMCTLYSLWSGKSAYQVLFSDMKGGYWFTFVTFEIYLFYILIESCLKDNRSYKTIIYFLLC